MKLVLLITANKEQGLQVAQAWQEIGAPGVTIVQTHGLRTLQENARKHAIELPMVVTSMTAVMAHLIENSEAPSELLFSVVEDDMVDHLQTAAEHIMGDMRKAYAGIMIVLDVERAVGVHHYTQQD